MGGCFGTGDWYETEGRDDLAGIPIMGSNGLHHPIPRRLPMSRCQCGKESCNESCGCFQSKKEPLYEAAPPQQDPRDPRPRQDPEPEPDNN